MSIAMHSPPSHRRNELRYKLGTENITGVSLESVFWVLGCWLYTVGHHCAALNTQRLLTGQSTWASPCKDVCWCLCLLHALSVYVVCVCVCVLVGVTCLGHLRLLWKQTLRVCFRACRMWLSDSKFSTMGSRLGCVSSWLEQNKLITHSKAG